MVDAWLLLLTHCYLLCARVSLGPKHITACMLASAAEE